MGYLIFETSASNGSCQLYSFGGIAAVAAFWVDGCNLRIACCRNPEISICGCPQVCFGRRGVAMTAIQLMIPLNFLDVAHSLKGNTNAFALTVCFFLRECISIWTCWASWSVKIDVYQRVNQRKVSVPGLPGLLATMFVIYHLVNIYIAMENQYL